ncbi:MAG: DUF3332 domain-containing protein [Chitinispirillia bacterium]|nr:DUF3332 domain-containing protein [Chitinispirillia bacterium]MCL2241659.1 DUF3332 domain-containing protein [Chitinispirillia bacterium]
MNLRKKLVCLATIAAVSITGVISTGCYGKYALFNKIVKAYGSLGNKWISSLVHLLTAHVVLGFCVFADFLIFNTIEFWTGSNPLAMGDTYEETAEDGTRIAAQKNGDGTLSVNMYDPNGNTSSFKLARDGNMIRVFDNDGNIIALHSAQ